MTEEEKKAEIERVKAEMAQKAVVFATAMSALSPTMANGQNVPENTAPDFPAPIEQTVSAMPSQTDIISIEEAENQPTFGSDGWLKASMLSDREEHNTAVAEQTAALAEETQTRHDFIYKSFENSNAQKNGQTLDEYRLMQSVLAEKFAQPCPNANGQFQIGCWSNINLTTFRNTQEISLNTEDGPFTITDILNKKDIKDYFTTRETPNAPKDFIDHSKIQTVPQDDKHKNAGAYYSPTNGSITMFTFSDEEKEQARQFNQEYGVSAGSEYILDNTVARNNVFFHEQNHKNDNELNFQNELYTTPFNAARGDRLTETKSCAVEYLAAAQQYTMMKEQGIDTIQINGENRPLESILEMYPGLKDVVLNKGFNAQDKQSVRNVVKAASEWWHSVQAENYQSQHMQNASIASFFLANNTISEQLELLKNEDETYARVSEQMLKNTQIAQNLTVDLSECRDLLDTMDKGKFTWMAYNYQKTNNQQPINTMTYEELSSINAYLESKGLTTDGQKAEYLASALDEIAHRGENQDEELKNLLLTRHSTLTYADGISESRIDNINMYRIQKDGKEYHIPDTLLTQIHEKIRQGNLDNDNLKFDLSPLQEMPQDVLLAENEMPSQMPSITLTPSERQEISNDMRHDRLNYDRELSEQTEALSHPISQAEQEQTAEHQPSAQTISPTMMKSLQQNTR